MQITIQNEIMLSAHLFRFKAAQDPKRMPSGMDRIRENALRTTVAGIRVDERAKCTTHTKYLLELTLSISE